jgi:L-alanine-DL-glutamate epimerase-like enolase superfamily enzyme
MPNFFITQLPVRAPDDPVRGLDLTVRDGYVALPTTPGLGVTVDEAALARYEVRA